MRLEYYSRQNVSQEVAAMFTVRYRNRLKTFDDMSKSSDIHELWRFMLEIEREKGDRRRWCYLSVERNGVKRRFRVVKDGLDNWSPMLRAAFKAYDFLSGGDGV